MRPAAQSTFHLSDSRLDYSIGVTVAKLSERKPMPPSELKIANRFRGFLPVVIDVETGGLNPATDALLEVAVQLIEMDSTGKLTPGDMTSTHVQAFEGANIEAKSLEITGIDPHHPLRAARDERAALQHVFQPVRQALRQTSCQRAILVGHNPAMDLAFLNAAASRTKFKRNPLHPFSTFDTATLAGLAYGQTVLARAARAANIGWDSKEAHSAVYDTRKTAELFCQIANTWHQEIGIPRSRTTDATN